MGQEKKILTANELTNVKDIRNGILYTKDNYIMMYLKIDFINIDLLPREEKKARTNGLSASFEADRKDFVYMAFPREIDLDSYKNNLKKRYSEEMGSIGRKHILREMILEATELATNGENYEHQHYIKIWKMLGADRLEMEQELRQRMADFKNRYEAAGIPTEVLGDQEILKMCNLYGNGIQAPFDSINSNTLYDPMLTMI